MRIHVALAFSLFLTPVSASCQESSVERVQHDHSIYLLSGDSAKLEKFHAEVGENWNGGILLDRNEQSGAYRYWAFDWRTAPQSRQFIVPAMFAGLDLNIFEYNDTDEHPELRAKLDAALSECDTLLDRFLILPTRHVTIFTRTEPTDSSTACLFKLIQDEKRFEGLKFGFLGSERMTPDEGN